MVKRAELIYQLLRNESVGQSVKDIMNKMSENYGITAGKGIKRQIRAALKRGVEFGALTRRYNRYSVDAVKIEPQIVIKQEKRVRRKRGTKKSKAPASTSTQKPQRIVKKSSEHPVPRPTVPPPPNWTTKPRNLRKEPLQKFIKHPENPFF